MRAADAALYRAKRNGGGPDLHGRVAGVRTSRPRPERRTMRRTTQERVRDAVQELTARFDGDLAHEGPLERIEAVAVALSEALNTAAWAISFAPAGGETIHTVSIADGRDKRLEGLHIGLDNEVYSVDEYPATARLLASRRGRVRRPTSTTRPATGPSARCSSCSAGPACWPQRRRPRA